MAGNEWINGYLEAILDSGGAVADDQKVSSPVSVRHGGGGGGGGGHFNPTKYFVEEVVTGVDETDLHRTWIKVVATRNSRERSTRLENMCWRIWHLTRKKKQVRFDSSLSSSGFPFFLGSFLHGVLRFFIGSCTWIQQSFNEQFA